MKNKSWILSIRTFSAVLLFASAMALAIPAAMAGSGHDHGEHSDSVAEPARGPHGGRWLQDHDFAVEVTIFERGVPPHYRVHAFQKGGPIDPGEVGLTIEVSRIGGRVERFRFRPEGDYLLGDGVVEEPHSFEVTVTAEHGGETHRWSYESYEGRVVMTPEAMAESGVVVERAGPAAIRDTIASYGRIGWNENRMVRVVPRYPGLIVDVRKTLGDSVAAGDVLAVVESNESLQRYEVRASIAGAIVDRSAVVGGFVAEGDAIFIVADLATMWIDFHVPAAKAGRLAVGQIATVARDDGTSPVSVPLTYVAPFRAEDTQTTLARAELPNPDGAWTPGAFIDGTIVIDEVLVPLAVRASALQTFRDWDVVFVNEGNVFEVVPLELGRRDTEWVEVLGGLEPGRPYAADNTFILRADVEKSGASHDH